VITEAPTDHPKGVGDVGTDGSEILVLLRRRGSPPDALSAHGHPVQIVSDRVFTLQLAPTASLADLHAEPDVRWAGTSPPPDVLEDLDADEHLFVEGWLVRQAGKPARPGEGLDWDTPGRLPPDPPGPPEDRPAERGTQ
jgi:hypothetical protein